MKSYNFYFEEDSFLSQLESISHQNQAYSALMVQIFTSITSEQKIKLLCEGIEDIFIDALIIGSTSEGEILGAKVSDHKTIISLTFFQNTFLKHVGAEYDHSFKNCNDFGVHIVSQLPSPPKALILFADKTKVNGDDFLCGVSSILPDCIITGGVAAGDKTFVFDNHRIYFNSAVGIAMYNPDLIALNISKSGWVPIGKEMCITHAKKNKIYTIDNAPALDVYKHYLGEDMIKRLAKIGIEFPLILKEQEQVRGLLGVDEDGSLTFAGNLATGDKVHFGYGSKEHFLSQHILPLQEFYNYNFESIFIYSCIARKKLMPDEIYREIEPYTHLADTCGFFTHGEFFTQQNKHLFLNQTMTLLALSENGGSMPHAKKHLYKQNHDIDYYYSQKAIMHLIKRSTEDIENLNKKLEQKVEEKIDEIRRKDILLFQQSKLASLGEMIGNIAHQWRQPINAIGALNMQIETTLLQKGSITYDEYEKIGQNINEQLEFISTTIDDFRIFTNNSNAMEQFNIKESLQTVISLLEIQFKHNNIDIIFQAQEFSYTGPKSELKHVFLNILNNAKDAIIGRGKTVHQNNYIFITIEETMDAIIISIRDSGGGIDDTIMHKIFDPYFTTKFKTQGTGIGLYMSNEIISKHFNGRIEVENCSTFYENETYTGAKFDIILSK